ncbi:hypothetical protein VNI00_011517 [Paramarasmius palmivorus]|uniref:NAD-dependent epimerase/dehydratase domain-containing protein n=1 Tax=Paramarasmius palmivorus TaxID=297713 RepID=A0AAW0CCL1_9AGAR
MPAITSPESDTKVLITGGTGYLGAWILRTVLESESGYIAIAVVRSESKGKYLREKFKTFGDRFQIVCIPDMQKDGAFDEIVRDVHGIIHVASPIHNEEGEPSKIIDPAVKSVTGLLNSVLKYGTLVKRIVFTSSCSTIWDELSSGKIFKDPEATWNEAAITECAEKGKHARPAAKYMASKVLAERAAWDIWHNNKDAVGWDLSVIIPAWVFGPHIHEASKPEDLTGSLELWYSAVVRGEHVLGEPSPGEGWVDVRDCAEAHLRALEVPAAGGERILTCASSPFKWQDWVDTANAIDPPPFHTIAKELPCDTELFAIYRSSKAQDILGLKYRSMKEVTADTLIGFSEWGW